MSPAERTIVYMSINVIDAAMAALARDPMNPSRQMTVYEMVSGSLKDLRSLADGALSQKDATTLNTTE